MKQRTPTGPRDQLCSETCHYNRDLIRNQITGWEIKYTNRRADRDPESPVLVSWTESADFFMTLLWHLTVADGLLQLPHVNMCQNSGLGLELQSNWKCFSSSLSWIELSVQNLYGQGLFLTLICISCIALPPNWSPWRQQVERDLATGWSLILLNWLSWCNAWCDDLSAASSTICHIIMVFFLDPFLP